MLSKQFELCSIDPFSPQTREETQSSIYENSGCGAGNLVCSVSLSGDVNPCSFLGPEFAAANIRRTPFEEIWHNSQGFRSIRGLSSDDDSFNGGCRARALVLNGSINAPDPWVTGQREQTMRGGKRIYHPLTVLDVSKI